MTDELKNNIIDFQLGRLSKEDFMSVLPFDTKNRTVELRTLIDGIIKSKISEDVQLGLTLLWLLEENNEFTDVLHKLILEPWHGRYEDIIHDLQKRKDSTSIPIIKIAIQQKYDSLESSGTGTGQFISQCGYALYSIGTEDAVNCITELSISDDEIIRNEMLYQLKRLSNHPDTENTEVTKRWWT